MNHLRIGRALAALAVAGCAASNAALPDLEGVVALGAGQGVGCASLASGGAACWGEDTGNASGILARTTSGRAAGPVGGILESLGRIAVGAAHACAVATDGRLWCWGNNDKGQLGTGRAVWGARSPTPVPALAGVSDIAAGAGHTCAVAAGAALCWGENTSGEIGDGTTLQRDAPVPVATLDDGVQRIAASGGGFSCAIADGAAWCWGANSWGQLGDRSTVSRLSPVPVAGLTSATTDIATGGLHACAVHAGAAWCWGRNDSGQLGDGTSADFRAFPVAVVNAARDVVAIAAGSQHSCAVRNDGAVLCWGRNFDGQLGDGGYVSRSVAAPVIGLAAPALAIAASESSTCVLLTTGRVQCFGTPLGIGYLSPRLKPVDVQTAPVVPGLSAGSNYTCGVGAWGDAFCFGNGDAGALGNGSRNVATWATPVTGLQSGVVATVAGQTHSCARTTQGAAFCWGQGGDGQLGDGRWADSLVPVAVAGLVRGVTDLAVGERFTCAVASGGARCWGSNGQGQLGVGVAPGGSNVPIAPWGLAQGADRVYAGSAHACALRSGGDLKCWGENWDGRLGDGTAERRYTAVDVLGLNRGVTDVSLGARHSCAVDHVGGVWCWGSNQNGQLGDGTQTSRPVPVSVRGLATGVVAVAAGQFHTCALLHGGEVRCWGSNGSGQVGAQAATWPDVLSPVAVPLGEPAYGVTAGGLHTCAVLTGGRAKCWGEADSARLGNGDVRRSPVPRTVKVGVFDATLAISARPNPSANGEYVTITARVDAFDSVPEGEVVFADGSVPLSCDGQSPRVFLKAGVASCTVPLFTGVHELRVDYPGSREALPASAAATFVVGPVAGQHCAGFDDVDAADPFCRDVEWLRNRSITQGCAPFAYCPADSVTRLTMAAFLDRLGGKIGPLVQTSSEIGGGFQSGSTYCLQWLQPDPGHPRRIVVDAVVTGVASAAATLRFELADDLSRPIGPAVTVSADPARATAVRLAGSLDSEPGATQYVGFRFAADPQVSLSDVRCIGRTQLFDRTGTHTPFDAPQGATP